MARDEKKRSQNDQSKELISLLPSPSELQLPPESHKKSAERQEEKQQGIAGMSSVTRHKGAETNEELFRTVLANSPVITFATNNEGIFTLIEGSLLSKLGIEPKKMVGTSIFTWYGNTPEALNNFCQALDGATVTMVRHFQDRVFDTQMQPLYDTQGNVIGVVGSATDVTTRVEAENMLLKREHHFQTLTDQAELVLILDENAIFRYASPSHLRIMGYAQENLIGTDISTLVHPDDLALTSSAFKETLCQPERTNRFVCRVIRANGSWATLECTISNHLSDPDIAGLIINAHDITERVMREELLRTQAYSDMLTGLPNREAFIERTAQALQKAELVQCSVALLIVDVNRFKEINGIFGHAHGDTLLREIGKRFRHAMDEAVMIAGLGGDKFGILLPVADEDRAKEVAQTIHQLLENPLVCDTFSLQIDVSIGVALYPAHGLDPQILLRRADVAMYEAKRIHQNFVLYNTSYDRSSARRLALIHALRPAISANQLTLYYQPKADIQTGQVHSVEALVRWNHPQYGLIPPDQFIPLAEQTGLIIPLSNWVMETAIRQCSEWLHSGLELSVSINLSAWDLRENTLPDRIESLLARYSVPPRLLCVELTESTMMTDTKSVVAILKRIAKMGVRLSIDDFGTGYSSLSYLKLLPVNEVKIDRSFVRYMSTDEVDATIVRSTVMMAHSLGLQIVAEGVEDDATWRLLKSLACDIAQGYYLSKPMPAADLENWLRTKDASSFKH